MNIEITGKLYLVRIMMNKKDIKEYHKMIKKLEEKKYGQKENEELKESYKESLRQTKERNDKKK